MLNSSTDGESDTFADGKIRLDVADRIAAITINNPAKRNAMSLDMWEGLGEALTELKNHPDVRVAIIVGAGEEAFISGADIGQFEEARHNAETTEHYSRRSGSALTALADFPKPTIACIKGFCLGGGMQVAMLSDIRIASESSQQRPNLALPTATRACATWYRSWGRHGRGY